MCRYRGEGSAFGHPQRGAARPGIGAAFVGAGLDRLADAMQATAPEGAGRHRDFRRQLLAFRFRAHETLHQAVFQRMKTDHHQPPPRFQAADRLRQSRFDFFKLAVNENPHSLKSPGRRVLAVFPGAHGAGDERRELAGRDQRRACSRLNKRPRNLPSKPLFAIVPDNACNLLFRRLVQPFRRRHPAAGVHAHVQRRVVAEAESARRLIQLRAGYAQIEQHPVHEPDAPFGKHFFQPGKRRVDHDEARVLPALAFGNGCRVPIQGDEPAIRAKPFENCKAVPAAAEGGIHVDAVGADCQCFDGILEEYGDVAMGHSEKPLSSSGRVPFWAAAASISGNWAAASNWACQAASFQMANLLP